MKNILVVVGSAHIGGSTEKLVDAWIKGANESGHHCTKIKLGEKEFQGCRGCGYCQNHDNHCVLNDAMQDYYPLFEAADMIVLASPLYFWTISARIKAFIERLYAISKNDQYPQKETMLLMTAGDDNFWTFEQPIAYYHFLVKALGWKDKGVLCAGGCEVNGSAHSIDQEFLGAVFEMGKGLNE